MAKHLKSITSDEIDQVVSTLDPAVSLFKYFSNNQIKANPHNYHSLINKDSRKKITIGGNTGVKINVKIIANQISCKVKSKTFVEDLRNNASQKIHAIAKITQ